VLNAADPASARTRGSRSLAERLFSYATELSRSLSEQPSGERNISDYRRALDAYNQVVRLNTDNFYSAEALSRRAELLREMADASNDSALYQQAIEAYRRVIVEHPRSAFVGEALINIARVYEENLQDLEGAAEAYRELIVHFPKSVMAREAAAVLARFDDQLRSRPIDVFVAGDPNTIRSAESDAALNNVRNFGSPDYARVVLDLSGPAAYSERRGANSISIQLKDISVAGSLRGRRFIVAETNLLKRIQVTQTDGSSTRVDIQVASLGDYSLIHLSDPERLIVDVHSERSAAQNRTRRFTATEVTATAETASTDEVASNESRPAVRRSLKDKNALYSLPEINEPILAGDHATAPKPGEPAESLAAKVDSKLAESPIKRIVIDPGHGGHDTGTISAGGLREKDLVLDVARKLRAYIKKNYPAVEVILTRDTDRFVALEERTAIANSRHADLFISIHANASLSRAASGVETFFVSPDRAKPVISPPPAPEATTAEGARPADNPGEKTAEGAAQKPQPMFASVTVGNRVAESRELARYIQSGLVRGIGAASPRTAINRGVKHAPFAVLLGAAMPSVLAEVSFLSNARDEALLQKSEFRERVALSLFAGLNAYLKKNRPEPKAQ
jgi:N-acetylmuramoyl-L-alanine amidase